MSLKQQPSVPGGPKPYAKNAGNVFFALFAAVAMVGAVGYGFNSVLRGPISAMSETTRRTVAESTLVTSSRLAIVGATTQQTNGGDTDSDGMIEPVPFKDAGATPHPVGGGHLPDELHIPNTIDPWNTQYGYCAWDHGAVTASTGRLAGSAGSNRYSIAIISAGRNKKFETSCIAYVDDSTQLIQLTPGSDDIVLAYTYAEANNLGNGLWKPKAGDPTVAVTDKNMEVTGGGTFSNKVELSGNTTTGGGLILPKDPGDNSLTGACSPMNDKQLRYNIGDGSEAPVIEICDDGGLGWTPVSGGAGGGGGNTTGQMVARYKLDEVSGTTAADDTGTHNGTLENSPTWMPGQGKIGGALSFDGNNDYVQISNHAALRPSAITIAAWVYLPPTQVNNNAKILIKEWQNHSAPVYTSYSWSVFGGSRISFETGHANNTVNLNGWAETTANQWNYITTVFDPAQNPSKSIYVNGILMDSDNETSPLIYDATAGGDLYLGSDHAGSEAVAARLDDLRIYNYGMTPEQVAALFASANPSSLNLTNPKKSGAVFSWGTDTSETLGNGTQGNRTAPGPVASGNDFIQVSGGGSHACGVKSDGTAWCWGDDSSGQLGNGSGVTANQSAPYQVAGLSNVSKISAGGIHTCALQNNGKIWCWGSNSGGALGTGGSDVAEPAEVALSNAIDISAGSFFTCAVTSDGAGWCWGQGGNGQLGNGTGANSATPVRVSDVSDFVSISAGGFAACGVTKRGIGYCWGWDTDGQLGNGATAGNQNAPSEIDLPEDFVKISVGGNSTACGLQASGKISCWGQGTFGQMGNGTTTVTNAVPVEVSDPGPFTDVAVAMATVCATKKSGTVWCWGRDNYRQLGDGDLNSSNATRPVQAKVGNAYQITAGTEAMFALVDTSVQAPKSSGDLNGKFTVAQTETNAMHACHIRPNGTIWCWGLEHNGEIGNGGAASETAASPVMVTDPGPWYWVSAGLDHTCGIKTDGSAWCWGDDSSGQLGNGGITGDQVSPSPVVNTNTIPWAQISAGLSSTCAIKADGSLWCWGSDTDGALGNGAGGNSTQPSAVASTLPWTMVSVGYNTACGIKQDSTLWCWGDAYSGKLGNGTTTPNLQSPAQIGTDKWRYIVARNDVSCGIKTDGSLWCWGLDENGKLGNGATLTANQTTPSLVAEPGPWQTVSSGNYRTCATKVDGTGWCWGGPDDQLGYGTTPAVDTPYPRRVLGADWAFIDGGGTVFKCGIKYDSSIWCMGNDSFDALGNGPGDSSSNYPQKIYEPYKSPFTGVEATTTPFAVAPVGSMAIGSTYLTDTEGTSQGLAFPGSGRSVLYQATTANQLMLETAPGGGAAQMWLNANNLPYYMGYNAYTGGLEFGLGSDWLTTITAPRLELANNGFVGIGTGGAPAASLDVRGAIRVGDAGSGCSGSNSGTIKYATSMLQYCNGSTWTPLAGVAPPTNVPWDTGPLSSDTDDRNACGIRANGTLWCWGEEYFGQLGNGGGATETIPAGVQVGSDTWRIVSTGGGHSCGIKADGTAWCWGEGADGKLGNNSGANSTVPVQVHQNASSTGWSDWVQISAGSYHTCGIRSEGTAWCWGYYQAAGGGGHALRPVRVRDTAGTGYWSDWKSISVGEAQTCGIRASGAAYCWGSNVDNVSLGTGTAGDQIDPAQVRDTAGTGYWTDWVKIATGEDGACGIRATGEAYCWGIDEFGQIGVGTTTTDYGTPQKVHDTTTSTGWTDWVDIASGRLNTCGIRATGQIYCWGISGGGLNGDNQFVTDRTRPHPVTTSATDWVHVEVGERAVVAVRANGDLYTWGYGLPPGDPVPTLMGKP